MRKLKPLGKLYWLRVRLELQSWYSGSVCHFVKSFTSLFVILPFRTAMEFWVSRTNRSARKLNIDNSNTSDKPYTLKTPLKKKYMLESEQRGAVLEKIRKYSKINNSPFHLKKQVMDQCILPTMTYGCQTWSLNKQTTNKLRTAQRAMERKMLDLKLKDKILKIPCSEIRKRTQIIDIIEYTLKQKWKWAGHIASLEDNRWTKRCTEWQPRRGKRSRGRPSRRWQDDREGRDHLD